MEEIPFLGRDGGDAVGCVLRGEVHAHQPGEIAACAHRFVDLLGDPARFVPFSYIGLDFGGDPFADFFPERGMCFVEVGGVVLSSVLVYI